MHTFRLLIFLFICVTGSTALCQSEDWLPVAPEDLQAKEPPSELGAEAIQLYYANWIYDSDHKQFFYNRVRILTKAGMKYAIYFPYAFTELDNMQIQIPSGFSAETVPVKHVATLSYANYEDGFRVADGQMTIERALSINGIMFNPETYAQFKDFFYKVASGDEQQAVLRRDSATAEKGN